jgi:hypothetical protein
MFESRLWSRQAWELLRMDKRAAPVIGGPSVPEDQQLRSHDQHGGDGRSEREEGIDRDVKRRSEE